MGWPVEAYGRSNLDESFRRDLTWQPTAEIRVWEMGDVGTDLVEIGQAAAMAIIERWRVEWQAAEQPEPSQWRHVPRLCVAALASVGSFRPPTECGENSR